MGLLQGPTRHTKQAGNYQPSHACASLYLSLFLSLSLSLYRSPAFRLLHPSVESGEYVESPLMQLKGTLLEILLRQKEFDADIRDATIESKAAKFTSSSGRDSVTFWALGPPGAG